MKNLYLTEITDNEYIEISGGKAGDAAYLIGFASIYLTVGLFSPSLLGSSIL